MNTDIQNTKLLLTLFREKFNCLQHKANALSELITYLEKYLQECNDIDPISKLTINSLASQYLDEYKEK